ncbi:MAG: acyltransferase [Cyclobacteriaceae bacterium]
MLIRVLLRRIFTMRVRRQARCAGPILHVNKYSSVTGHTSLGNNVNFNGMKIRGNGTVSIGDNFHCGEECIILTDNHNYDKGTAIPYDSTYLVKETIIEDNVWLGSRVILLPGVHLGEGCIVQAGSVVTRSVPKFAIVGGNPAKQFKTRDVEHYNRLKSEKKFH